MFGSWPGINESSLLFANATPSYLLGTAGADPPNWASPGPGLTHRTGPLRDRGRLTDLGLSGTGAGSPNWASPGPGLTPGTGSRLLWPQRLGVAAPPGPAAAPREPCGAPSDGGGRSEPRGTAAGPLPDRDTGRLGSSRCCCCRRSDCCLDRKAAL